MKKYKIDMNLALIQNIRFAQALMEVSDDFFFDSQYNHIFEYLNQTLETNYPTVEGQEDSPKVKVDFVHAEPSITVGDSKYILIYPNIIGSYLKPKWQENRTLTTFNGILTKKRYRFIQEVIKRKEVKWNALTDGFKFSLLLKLPKRLVSKIFYNLNIHTDELKITFTNKGRKFPVKAWDNDYFNTLLNSKYVLCPDGDFIWTYRFFESIICGAMPVIENTCSAYQGFHYLTLDQYIKNETLTNKQREENFNKLMRDFTLNTEDVEQLISAV